MKTLIKDVQINEKEAEQGRRKVNEVNRCWKETEKMTVNTTGQERKADDGNISVCERANSACSTLCTPLINQRGS